MKKSFLAFIYFLAAANLFAQSPAPCDTDKSCIGQALTQSVNQGKGAHYVDIDKNPSQNTLTTALTVEFWMKPERQAGARQFIAGLWGPGVDNNDVWAIYISPSDELVFEINGPQKRGSADNTIARISASGLYNSWNHIAAVFDGSTQSAKIFVNGTEAASARNSEYPAARLHSLEKPELLMQIGSTNGLSDDTQNRTFRGRMDEIRIWSKALSQPEIFCQKDRSLNGNEAGLVIYYRCNQQATNFSLCDATGNGNTGRLRSGASCQPSDRTATQTVSASPTFVKEELKCDSSASYTFSITDTSACGNMASLSISGKDSKLFSLSKTSLNLVKGVAETFSVTFTGRIVGTIQANIEINFTGNRCQDRITIPVELQRSTELKFSFTRTVMDTLYAGCRDYPYADTVLTITNNSAYIGSPRAMRIDSAVTRLKNIFEVTPISPVSFPATLAPGESMRIRIRFHSKDTTAFFNDTLRVFSDDRCPGNGFIPVGGNVREVLVIRRRDGITRLDSIDFRGVCPGQLSAPVDYIWFNLSSRKIDIDSIRVPADFTGRSLKFPAAVLPSSQAGAEPNFFRFRPQRPGTITDSIIFYTQIQGCTIEKKIYVRGYGYTRDIEFSPKDTIDFGDVIVGQQKTIQVKVKNRANDTLRVAFYMESGEVFYRTGATGATLAPGDSAWVPLTFRPTEAQPYSDKLRLFEQRCFTPDSIPVKGRGILQTFEFRPVVMRTLNVPGCSSRIDSIEIRNISSAAISISGITLDDPSGKFSFDPPASAPKPADAFSIPANGSKKFYLRFTPNDVSQDLAIRAYLRYRTPDNTQWAAPLYGTSAAPKLFVTQLTTYGSIEIGDSRMQRILIENISALQVRVDEIRLPAGYSLSAVLYKGSPISLPKLLDPRDSIFAEVLFAPVQARSYDSLITVVSASPCPVSETGTLKAKGVIVELDVKMALMNFGYVRSCDCKTREFVMVNQSLINPMTVDSLWINDMQKSGKIQNGAPQFYTWTSTYSPDGSIPYNIPKNSSDTVRITYCPRSPAEDRFIDNNAVLHLAASGSNWKQKQYEMFMAGKRSLSFRPSLNAWNFADTYVDTLSNTPGIVDIIIPGVDKNPNREAVTIDSISFEPDDRVFSVRSVNGRTFPMTIEPDSTLKLRFDFKPRAPKYYKTRVRLHISKPCSDIDTTIALDGRGFARPFSLDFAFGDRRTDIDTFRITSCDTLLLPVYSSRAVPADLVDISFRLDYDTTALRFAGLSSPYTGTDCPVPPRLSSATAKASTKNGIDIVLKNFCTVDSVRPFVLAKFVSANGERSDTEIRIDSIEFDSDEVIFYKIIAGNDLGHIIVQKPAFEIQNDISFDSVRILDCAERTFRVRNSGDVPLSIDSLLDLPADISVSSAVPALSELVPSGEEITLTLKFCPQDKRDFDTNFAVRSADPCPLDSINGISGTGYAPKLPVRFSMSADPSPALFSGMLADTVVLPVYLDRNISAVYDGREYFLQPLSFDLRVRYSHKALKFISASSPVDPAMQAEYIRGEIVLHYYALDSLRAGKVADMTFVVLVPDTVQSALFVSSENFSTTGIPFLDIVPDTTETGFTTGGKCNLSYLKYSGAEPLLGQSYPNPASDKTTIEFEIRETVPATLKLYSVDGNLVETILDGSQVLKGGRYSLELPTQRLGAGLYYYTLSAGVFSGTRTMLIVK